MGPRVEARSIPYKYVSHAEMEKRGRNQFFFLSYLTYRETMHKTKLFGKLKQTFSKKQQENCKI